MVFKKDVHLDKEFLKTIRDSYFDDKNFDCTTFVHFLCEAIIKKWKKHLEISSFYTCLPYDAWQSYDNHMMYGSWDMLYET